MNISFYSLTEHSVKIRINAFLIKKIPEYIQETREIGKGDRCDGNVQPKVTSGKRERLRTGDPADKPAANHQLPFQCPGFRPLNARKVCSILKIFDNSANTFRNL